MGKRDSRRSNKMKQRKAQAKKKIRMKQPLAERIKRAHRPPKRVLPPPPPPAPEGSESASEEASE